MPRVNLSDLGNYGGGGKFKKVNYLSLQNDGDSAQVHFLINNEDDLNECIYVTHNVKLKSAPKLKYGVRVNCLRNYNDPLDDCPFCREGIQTGITCAIPVYNVDTEQVEFWTRGKKEAGRLLRKMSKVKKNFSSHLFELTRIGESGDQSTDYEYDDLGTEEIDELDVPEILGSVVLDKSADDMEYWIDEHDFPPEDNSDDEEEEAPRRRRPVKENTKTRRKPEPEEEDDEELPFDEDEEEEEVRPKRKATGGRRAKRRTPEDEF